MSAVEPAYKKTERLVFFIRKAELAVLVFLAVENVAEELTALAALLLVQDPFRVLLANVEIDHLTRQQPR